MHAPIAPSSRRRSVLALLSVVALAATGCGHKPLPEPELPSTVHPQFVSILTDGIALQGQEDNWDIPPGDPVAPPFSGVWPKSEPIAAGGDLLEKYPVFVGVGAKRCRMRVPGRVKPLYCVLALLPVFETSTSSSARRTFRISIPPERIEQALGGQVSVVYEPYPYVRKVVETNENGQFYADKSVEAPSWILWLSDAPFAGGTASKSRFELADDQARADQAKADQAKADQAKAAADAAAKADADAKAKAAADAAAKAKADADAEAAAKAKPGKKPGKKLPMRRFVLGCALALAACGPPRPPVAPAPPREACVPVGRVSSDHDLAALRAFFRARHHDLIVSENMVFDIPCSTVRIAGASEDSETRGHSEDSRVTAHSEDSRLAGANEESKIDAHGEGSRVAASGEGSNVNSHGENSDLRHAGEASDVAHAGEHSVVAHAGEDSALDAASSHLFCERLGSDQYRVLSDLATAPPLRVFDGAVLVEVKRDGVVR